LPAAGKSAKLTINSHNSHYSRMDDLQPANLVRSFDVGTKNQLRPEDWWEENWPTLHCLSSNMAEFTFAAARAMATFGDGSGYWLKAAWDGAVAIAGLVNCMPPPFEDVEEFVGVTILQCQCSEVPGELLLDWLDESGNSQRRSMSGSTSAKKILSKRKVDGVATCRYESDSGEEIDVSHVVGGGTNVNYYISPPDGFTCCEGEQPPPPNYGTPAPHPVDIGDPEWEYVAKLRDATLDKFGYLRHFYEVDQYLKSNGTYGGREFYWESIDGPIWYYDRDSFEGFASNQRYGPPHRDRMQWFPQSSDDGTIPPERPTLEGDIRTIHFVSNEKTEDGGTCLRKRFRYRSTNGQSLGAIVDHWRDFVWQAGPVCVGHVESSWGNPQVWAASANEGKRVIRHAAGEAGINPDQDGRWVISGSLSSRYGMPGTMRVSTRGGVYRITARDGSDGPPMVAIKPYDP
jgi:hypothetical protein